MRRPFIKALFVLEVIVCFGPIALVTALGVILIPIWVGILVTHYTSDVPTLSSGNMPWDVIWPMLMVIGGILGLIGVARVTTIVLSGEPRVEGRSATLFLVAAGLAAIGLFVIVMGDALWSVDQNASDIGGWLLGVMMYVGLPGFGSAHLLYLARYSLFGTKRVRSETLTGVRDAA